MNERLFTDSSKDEQEKEIYIDEECESTGSIFYDGSIDNDKTHVYYHGRLKNKGSYTYWVAVYTPKKGN